MLRIFTLIALLVFTSISLNAGNDRDLEYVRQLDSLAEISFSEGEIDRSISLWKQAVELSRRVEVDSLDYSGYLQSLGVCYRRKSMSDSAMYYYNEAWNVIRDMQGSEAASEKTRLLTSIAILCSYIGRDQEAVEYAERSIPYAEATDDLEMYMYTMSNCGAIFARNGDFDKGSATIRKSLEKVKELGSEDRELSALTLLISVFNLAGEEDSIDKYLAHADGIASRLPENSVAVLGYRELQAALLRKMGRWAESNAVYESLLSASGENSAISVDQGYLTVARNYMELRDYASASRYYEKAFNAVDSMYNEEITAQISEWSAKYGAAEKELEIARLTNAGLQDRAAKQRWTIAAVSLMVVLVAIVLTVIFRRRQQKKEEDLRMAKQCIEGLEKERARVAKDLHDGVCNDLLGIGMRLSATGAHEPGTKEADKYLYWRYH